MHFAPKKKSIVEEYMWFVCALLTALGWGIADIFYKKGSVTEEKYSHLKICIFVGIAMGLHAIFVLTFQNIDYNPVNIIYYFPVSFMYFFAMVLTFFGLKFIEDSIASPVENSSGAITAILCFLILKQRMSMLSLIGVIFVTIGVISLGIFEAKTNNENTKKVGKKLMIVGFMMAVCYSLFNAIGGFLDAYFLDIAVTPLKNVSESTIELVANTSYELTFLIIAAIFYVFITIKKEKMNWLNQKDKLGAAVFETFGQLMYVYAMSGNAIIAAPIVSSVCVVSVILARIFLKEKMTKKQYIAITSVIVGILILAIAEA